MKSLEPVRAKQRSPAKGCLGCGGLMLALIGYSVVTSYVHEWLKPPCVNELRANGLSVRGYYVEGGLFGGHFSYRSYLSIEGIGDLSPLATHADDLRQLSTLDITSNSDLTPLAALPSLDQLFIYKREMGFEPIADLTKLNWLWFKNCKIEESAFLDRLVALEDLQLHHTTITEFPSMQLLSNLRSVTLRDCQVGPVVGLADAPNLKHLDVKGTSIRPSDLDALREALPNCVINLRNGRSIKMSQMTDSDIAVAVGSRDKSTR